MRTRMLMLVACLALAGPALAQVPTLDENETFNVLADQNGQDTDGYRVWLCAGSIPGDCDTQLGADYPRDDVWSAGTVTVPNLAGLARGTYSIQLTAYNADREVRSSVLVFNVLLPAPGGFSGLRIAAVDISADGTVNLRLLDRAQLDQFLRLEFPGE